jgi:NADH-ubiquinone oxidoreductase chain 5
MIDIFYLIFYALHITIQYIKKYSLIKLALLVFNNGNLDISFNTEGLFNSRINSSFYSQEFINRALKVFLEVFATITANSLIFLLVTTLTASLFIGLFGRILGKIGTFYFSLLNLIIIWCFFDLIYSLLCNSMFPNIFFELILCEWINYGSGVDFGFLVDNLSIEMGFVVLAISTCVILYSFDYLSNDPHIIRFVSYLFLFVFFMLLLIFSSNLLQYFIGWEGVGLVSFLLVNFWFTRLEANRSAAKAILFNRIGDMGFVVAIVLLFVNFGTLDFIIINNLSLYPYTDLVVLVIFLGAMGKSAQLGLHAWLPDAMEGPTPVSALLHSATMVTVGVFTLLRLSPIIINTTYAASIIAIIGSLTALIAAIIAIFQEDIKKIIAYSTCSQLGLMIGAIGMFNFTGSFFHLVTHAFFKALLFLTAGAVIHALANEQDIRKMGGLFSYLPFTALVTLIGTLGLIGFPFLSGFYSKEFLLFSILHSPLSFHTFIFINVFLASLFTILYSLRVFFFVFFTTYRGPRILLHNVTDSPFLTNLVLFVLSIVTLFFGYFYNDLYIGIGNDKWRGIFPTSFFHFDRFIYIEISNFFLKLFLMIIIFFVLFITPIFFNKFSIKIWIYLSEYLLLQRRYSYFVYRIYSFFSEKFWFASLYRIASTYFFEIGYNHLLILLDRGLFEKILIYLPLGIVNKQVWVISKTLSTITDNLLSFLFILILLTVRVLGFLWLYEILGFFLIFLFLTYLSFNLQESASNNRGVIIKKPKK